MKKQTSRRGIKSEVNLSKPAKSNRFHMCSEFYKFGIALAMIGIVFFFLNFLFGFTISRVLISFMFLLLSILDLGLYVRHGEG